MTFKTQADQILNYLRTVGPMTKLDALNAIQCMNAGARIEELRKSGYPIKTEMVKLPSGKRVARYSLEEETNG